MQNHKNNFQIFDENALFEVAIISVIGSRKEQQDCVGYEIKPDEGLVVVCDGMGGHNGGQLASSIAVDMLIKKYLDVYPCDCLPHVLLDTIEKTDRKIASLNDEDGVPMQAGTTIAVVVVRGKTLHWISVGDSRIYLFRDGELVQVTEDHIYQTVLDEKRERGLIDENDYEMELLQGEALVSFLGVNGIPKIDANVNPLPLLKDDKIILMSDGLYKLVPDEEIGRILSNFNNIEDASKALDLKAQRISKNHNVDRDNMTVAIIKIK